MAKRILVTSFKGGVGKTTVSANLAACLARHGRRVLACDCDLESRSLDLILGVENQPLFNICDAVKGVCEPDKAIVQTSVDGKLDFMPAPAFYPEAFQSGATDEIFTEQAVEAFLEKLDDRYDDIIFDLPARPDNFYMQLVRQATLIWVISQHTSVSIRAAEKTGIAIHELCAGKSVPSVKLVVNGFRPEDAANGERAGLYRILTDVKLPLAGVIPYDTEMLRAQEAGRLADVGEKTPLPFWQAIDNTVRRISGENVRLLEGIRLKKARRRLF